MTKLGSRKLHVCPKVTKMGSIIVLRAVTIYRPETQTNKLKLILANSLLFSDFCHSNVMFVCLLLSKWEKWQNSDKNFKLVTLMSFTRYAIDHWINNNGVGALRASGTYPAKINPSALPSGGSIKDTHHRRSQYEANRGTRLGKILPNTVDFYFFYQTDNIRRFHTADFVQRTVCSPRL